MRRQLGDAFPLRASADLMHRLGVSTRRFVVALYDDDLMMHEAALVTPALLQNMMNHFGSNVGSLAAGDVVLFGLPFLDDPSTVATDVDAPIEHVAAADDPDEMFQMVHFVTPRPASSHTWENITDEESRGGLMRIHGARTRFFLDATGRTREVGIASQNYLDSSRVQQWTWPSALGDMFVFERCFLDEPYDICVDRPLPERVFPLSAEEFAAFRPLHVTQHRVTFSNTSGTITSPWLPGDPDPDADALFDAKIVVHGV